MSERELSVELPGGLWERVRELRAQVSRLAGELPAALRAAEMATAEMVENAIKYGERGPRCEGVLVRVAIEEQHIAIEVGSGVSRGDHVAELRARIEQIEAAEDREALYVGRLAGMLSSPETSGKLGLYRVAFEGGFDLRCEIREQVLWIRATRALT